MSTLAFNDLLAYTEWERQKWFALFRKHPQALSLPAGPHGDGRFEKVGAVIHHVFSAERRYVDRLANRPITDTSQLPSGNLDALIEQGQHSRQHIREFIATFPASEWDTPFELTIMNSSLMVTPRKIITHVLLHEIRHWAQIATLLRLNGIKDDFHDFLFSPVMNSSTSDRQI